MAIVLVKSYHWIKGKKHAQLTCWNCQLAMGVVGMKELQKLTSEPTLPVVCFECGAKREKPPEITQLELISTRVKSDDIPTVR